MPSSPKTTSKTTTATEAKPTDADPIAGAIEAILLSVDRPAPASKLAEAVLPGDDQAEQHVREAIAALNASYAESGRAFRIERLAGGFRIMTNPEYADAIAAFRGARARTSLSRAAIETLAIVAYRQPVTRAQLEAIRGVACGEVLRTLLDRRLLTVVGRAEELGRPMLYGTTRQFLDSFGLASLKDLPLPEEGNERLPGASNVEEQGDAAPTDADAVGGDEVDGGSELTETAGNAPAEEGASG